MSTLNQISRDYETVERAIEFLERHARRRPSLAEIAGHVNLSEFHFQRLFSRWVGISPKRFLQFVTKDYAKKLLENSRNILDVAYDTGLSGPGRLHDLMVACEAVTPGEYRDKGEGLTIAYGFHPSPFGACLLAVTGRGICALRFVQDGNGEGLVNWLKAQWPRAEIKESPDKTRAYAQAVFTFASPRESAPLHLHVKGTNFQIKVWEALLDIPLGHAVTYEDVALHIGMPKAARAVGNAVGQNPIPFLIPCHRVIKKLGDFGNYGEGPLRKKALIGWEAAQFEKMVTI